MMGRNGQQPLSGRQLAGCLFLAALVAGCGGRDSAESEIERKRKEYHEPVVNHAEFSGTVTIDNQPPAIESRHVLLLMLYDPKNPPTQIKPPRYAIVQNDGTFKFGQGGVPPGSYVALFAGLQRGRPGTFRGPDALKNLYNDPDKNQNIEALKVDVPQSGKTQNFDLEISGKDQVTPRGEHSIVQFFAPPQ